VDNGWTGDAHASSSVSGGKHAAVSGGTLHFNVKGDSYVTQTYGYKSVSVSGSSSSASSVSASASVSKSGKSGGGGGAKSIKISGFNGMNVSGSKSGKGSGPTGTKSVKIAGVNGMYASESTSVTHSASGRSSGGTINISGISPGSTWGSSVEPVNPIEPSWTNDGYVQEVVTRGKWYDDGHTNAIVTPNPTPRPTWKGDAFTSAAPTPCEEKMMWHPNSNYDMCTNDNNYPSNSQYIYESLEMCCMAIEGKTTCQYNDICVPDISPAPTPCEAQVFFFDGNTCTNEVYIADATAYNNVMICCNFHFGAGSYTYGTCDYKDTCNPVEPIVTPPPVTPAPTPCEAKVFFFDGNACTNEIYIVDAMSYSSLMICCNVNFGTGSFMNGGCNYVDECNTLPPTKNPTKRPTASPSASPTTSPSASPTKNPTKRPTASPSASPTTPTPNPVTPSPTLNPVTPSPTLNPVTPSPTLNPVTPSPTLNPVTDEPTPAPIESIQTNSPTPAPTPCEAKIFFYDGNTCSNEFYLLDTSSYNSVVSCCDANFGAGSYMNGCNYVDECNSLPPTLAPIETTETPPPSPSPTMEATFGSTPTVSKETTGPPTMTHSRPDVRSDDLTTDETTDCREITGGHPVVCVKVCTTITSIFDGDTLVDESAKTSESECD